MDELTLHELTELLSSLSGTAWTRAEAEAFQVLIAETGWDLHKFSPLEWRELLEQAKPFCTELGRARGGDEGARQRLLAWSDRTLAPVEGGPIDLGGTAPAAPEPGRERPKDAPAADAPS